jgi:nitroreductase/RimJ/RimL family protein N-acetyltransferase
VTPHPADARAHLAGLRAVRHFTPEPVTDADLRRVLATARWAGSARNRQPWRFVVTRDATLRAELSRLGAYAAHLADAPLAVLLAVDTEHGGEDAEFDAGRAAQTLMLAAHALGLGSCPASFFPAVNARRATALAGLAHPWRVRSAISLGRPAPAPAGRSAIPTGRRPLDDLVGTAPAPQPVLDAGPLRLRPFTPDDTDWVHATSLDPAMRRFIDLPDPYGRADAEYFVRHLALDGWAAGTRAEFLAEDVDTGRRLGRVGLALPAPGATTGEIGYWTAPDARGGGVAARAAYAVCAWAFAARGLEIVTWRAEVGNDASRRVAEKIGFRVEAVLRRRLRHRGHLVDAWAGSLLPTELHAPAGVARSSPGRR